LIGADYAVFRAWAGSHGNAMLLILFTVIMFHHAYLGIQVVIEDYVHGEAVKTVSLVVTRFVAVFAAASCIMAVFRLAFGN
jgi:succinate dehydrogenase / fumarate reductase membrane anchor subunit